jgi:hypothetical protein
MADGCELEPATTTTTTSDSLVSAKTGARKVCRSETHIVLQVPEADTPVPAPRTKLNNKSKVPTLLVLFPPEGIKKGHHKDVVDKSDSLDRKNIFIQHQEEEEDVRLGKDFASLVHPTAPRVPAPLGVVKSPPPTVRGPKGVNHPQLRELLNNCKARYKVVFGKKEKPLPATPPPTSDEEAEKEKSNR